MFLCPTDVTTSNYGTAELKFKLILHVHGPGSPAPAVMPIVTRKFITVDPLVFKEGINYSSKVFGSHFPAVWAVILDMRAMLRNLIYTNTGTSKSCDIFSLHATEFLSELEVVSGGLGQPIKKGMFSLHVILSLILAHRNGVQPDWVCRIHVTCRTKNPEFGMSCMIPCEFHSMLDKSNLWNVSVRVAVLRLLNLTNGVRPGKVQVDGKQSCKYGNRFYILSSLANLQQTYYWSHQQGKRPTGEIVQVCNHKSITFMYNCWPQLHTIYDLAVLMYYQSLLLCTLHATWHYTLHYHHLALWVDWHPWIW